ncbi:hypothetical protein PENSPDRAFT_657813 [Peniophora sp. CONT]|nr:hypothetical protein PENSPDRAFT_657813 [Peniophora sp. CONT]
MDANTPVAKAPRFPEVSAHIQQTDDSIAAGHASSQLESDIELEITELEAAASRLRTSRNSCRPLLRLPLETLGEIMDILASVWPATTGFSSNAPIYRKRKRRGLALGWVLLGHVCRKLRNALLARHDIWARNICSITRSPSNMAPYYGDAPLHIDVEAYNSHDGEPGLTSTCVGFIAQHIGLSRAVKFHEWGRWMDGALFANIDPGLFTKTTFPHLKRLELLSETSPYGKNPAITADIFELPEMVAPSLRSLRLKNYMISFDPSTLTTLSLALSLTLPIYSSRGFLKMIRRCHRLRSLKLVGCIPQLPLGVAEVDVVLLTLLEELHIEGNVRRCLGLLSHLSLSPSARYRIECSDIQSEFTSSSGYLDATFPHFEQMNTCHVSGLTISESLFIEIALFSPMPDARCDAALPGPFRRDFVEQLLIRFYHNLRPEPRIKLILSHLQKITNFSAIDTLEVGSNIAYDHAAWAACFSRFPNITTLYLLNMSRTSAPLALIAPDSDEGVKLDSERLVAPRLRFLWLSVLDLRDPRNDEEAQQPTTSRLQLLHMLSSRMKAGVPLDRLRIESLIVPDIKEAQRSFVTRLETLVQYVEIDDIYERDPETESDDEDEEDEDEDESEDDGNDDDE